MWTKSERMFKKIKKKKEKKKKKMVWKNEKQHHYGEEICSRTREKALTKHASRKKENGQHQTGERSAVAPRKKWTFWSIRRCGVFLSVVGCKFDSCTIEKGKCSCTMGSVRKCNHTIERISSAATPLRGFSEEPHHLIDEKRGNRTIEGRISRGMSTILECEKVQPYHWGDFWRSHYLERQEKVQLHHWGEDL